MRLENLNEWIYYYFMKDEEALPLMIQHFEPMVLSLYSLYRPQNGYYEDSTDDYLSIANSTLVECLNNYRFASNSPFYLYYYMCLKRDLIDYFRRFIRLHPPKHQGIVSLENKIHDTKTFLYRDVLHEMKRLNLHDYVMSKCQADYLLEQAKREFDPMDYKILCCRQDGYTVLEISQMYNISTQFVYYRLKKIRNWFTAH